MKKICFLFLTITVFILQTALCFSQSGDNEMEKIKGCSELKVYEYTYKFGEIDPESKKLREHCIYDKEGNIVEEPQSITKYKYNDKNLKIEKTRYYRYQGKNKLKHMYKYNDKDSLIEETCYHNGELNYKNVYKYNDKGLKIEETHYDEQGKPERKSVYKYNNNDLCIEETHYNRGKLSYKYAYKYNDKGLIIEKQYFDFFNEELQSITKYKYNNKGLLEETNFNRGIYDFKEVLPHYHTVRYTAVPYL